MSAIILFVAWLHIIAGAVVVGLRSGVLWGAGVFISGTWLLVGMALLSVLMWTAKGEPDVNGGPERDASEDL